MTSRPSHDLVGAQLGPYRLERLIGEGGMARVYRGTGEAGVVVAIKVVRGSIARDTVFRKRFEREARIARQVTSSRLVPLLDAGEHDGLPFLVQPFMVGGSLEDRLAGRGRLAISEALEITGDVGEGLAALAAEGFVHRDVKPANVLFDEAGSALVADFGLVRDNRGTVLTRAGQPLGSPHYMAPEQIRGEQVSSATDVYSLGCVLCECLSGDPPFARERGMQVLWAQLTASPPDPCADLPDAPRGFGTAVLRALAKDPSERPPTALEYVRLVRDASGIEPASGRARR